MMQKDGRSERRRALNVNIRKPMCGGVSNVNKGNLNLFTHLLLFTDLDTLIDTHTHTHTLYKLRISLEFASVIIRV